MLYEKLLDWQKEIVDNIQNRKLHNYGLFLDMGLGKTIVGLSLAEVNKCTKVIIVSINGKALESKEVDGSFLYWAFKSDVGYENVFTKEIFKNKSGVKFEANSKDILILNYESLYDRKNTSNKIRKEIEDFIIACKGQNICILIDESHKIADHKSKQSKAIFEIQSLCKKVSPTKVWSFLMSGTPNSNGYISIWNQLKFLGCPLTLSKFKEQFCIEEHVYGRPAYVTKIKGYKNIDSLNKVVHYYGVTLESEDVIKLPPQIFIDMSYNETVYFKLFTKEKLEASVIVKENEKREEKLPAEYYTPILEAFKKAASKKVVNPYFRNIDFPSMDYICDTTSEFWIRSREMSIGFVGNSEKYIWYDYTRLNLLKDLLKEKKDNYILFYSFTPELLEIAPLAEELGYNLAIYSGDIKNMDSYYTANSEKPTLVIGNWQSMSTGVNLQKFNKVIIFDYPVYRDWAQGLKRVHRIGQQSERVLYYVLCQNNWLDNGMKNSLNEKIDYTKEMFKKELNKYNGDV